MARIASLLSYPVDCCHGVRVKSLAVGALGAEGDRQWRVLDERGPVSAAELHRVYVEARGAELVLTAAGHPRAALPGEGVDAWFSALLGRPARCVPRAADEALPLLAVTTASLADLNQKLPGPVGIERFCPNLVLEGTAPFDEDDWVAVKVGGARFVASRPQAPRLDMGVELRLDGKALVQLRPGQTLELELRAGP